jgi:hypothetical protein
MKELTTDFTDFTDNRSGKFFGEFGGSHNQTVERNRGPESFRNEL